MGVYNAHVCGCGGADSSSLFPSVFDCLFAGPVDRLIVFLEIPDFDFDSSLAFQHQHLPALSRNPLRPPRHDEHQRKPTPAPTASTPRPTLTPHRRPSKARASQSPGQKPTTPTPSSPTTTCASPSSTKSPTPSATTSSP
jgi:hypothetical protein